MKKIYLYVHFFVPFFFLFPKISFSQCATLTASCITYESRCAATGAIKVNASGGSGSYKYKTTGPVNTNFTTIDSITGLSAGVYDVIVNDIVTNCNYTVTGVIVPGTYQDPRFTLAKIDVSCDNASNGSIMVNSYSYGRAPFVYTIVAPSPMGIGTSNGTGVFNNLGAGDYTIRMTDSCGGIQTRQITVLNYTWWIDAYAFTKTACDQATGYIRVVDSRGNISTVGGIPGFMYGIVRAPGDTIWSSNPNFTFQLMGHNTFTVVAKDNCGIIKKANASVSFIPTVAANVNTYGYQCNYFSASLSVGVNFLSPEFCLYDSADVLVSCNTNGVFTAIPYGSYCIRVHDDCTDTTVTRCFNVGAPPISLSNTVLIMHKTCTSFTASITGQVGWTNPQYCLYDSSHTLISCNSTGVFNGLSYQPYCIETTDGCRDTTITRCFNPLPPVPIVPQVLGIAYITCTNFGINVGADSLTAPLYCLYDSTGTLIICNNNGVFDSIPIGNYCVTIHDSCYDTTITRCINSLVPVANNDLVTAVRDKTCSDFSITISSQHLNQPEYCLYDINDVQLTCNTTGVFTHVPYGTYCIKTHVACPDTLFTTCFSEYPALPTLSSSIHTSNFTCTDFTAETSHEENLTNPTYCLYDSRDALVSCNTRGQFQHVPYGTYCIKITDGCYDTTITRCFSETQPKVNISGTSDKSCSYGWAQFSLDLGNSSGYFPVNVKVYNPDGTLFKQANYNSNNILIDSIPGLATGIRYKVVATDNCGNKDSVTLGANASYFHHTPTVVPKCPSATWANGSGNIKTNVSTNMGSLTVKIIKKNGVTYSPSLSPNTVSGGIYSFIDLGPGTYIVSYQENNCNRKLYDTVVISNYQYPDLDRSSGYQCDINGFSISAIVTNGVGPFTYEIIGSQPATPSIVTSPQSSPIFTINNGATYSLVRLRVLDACGNASLGDASILPLAINGVVSSTDCFAQPTTLTVDSIFNSSYAWYKKDSLNATDSVLIASDVSSYHIPTVSPADTGVYVCYVSVNSGCITRSFVFHLGGQCWIVLPLKLASFDGQALDEKNLLRWVASSESSLKRYVVERRINNGNYTEIGSVDASGYSANPHTYQFYDNAPARGMNSYRLRMENLDRSYVYSDVVVLNNTAVSPFVSVYPNPVVSSFNINLGKANKHHYIISLYNAMAQPVMQLNVQGDGTGQIELQRPSGLQKGIYILKVKDVEEQLHFEQKIVFL